MDEKLNRSNRLPGSEKLTRPEEIGQLSKYLKKIKESYEESTRLEDQLVGVAGYSTGKIPEITKLGDKMVGTPGKRDEIGLTKKVLGIPDNTKENKLEETRLTLTDSRENKLRDSVIEKPENVGEEVDRLSSVIKKIEDVRDQKLENKRVGLEDGREIKLGNTRLDLQAMINASLENKRVRLELKNEDPKLEDTKLNISDQREHKLGDKVIGLDNIQSDIKLEETRLDIQDARVDSLETKRIGLEDVQKITKLEDTRLIITDPRENKLGEKKVEIEDKREIGLENKRVELGDVENVDKLGNKRIGIEDSRENKLEETRLDLTDSRNIELGNKKENLWDDRNLSLPNTRLDIYDDWKGELENKQEKLWDDREPKLPNTRKNLYDDRNIELGNKRENLWDDRNPELPNTRKDLKDDRNINLPDSRLDLKDDKDISLSETRKDIRDDRNIELPNTRLDIKDDWKGELGDKKIELQDDRELELPNTRLDLEDEREGELEDKRLDLTDDREYELGSSAIGLSPNQSVVGEDEVGLSDYVARLVDDREPSLSDKLLNLIDDREVGLGNKRINLTDDRDIGLEDKRLDLEDGRENELEDKRLDLDDERENKLEDKRLDLTDDRENKLEDKILELTDDREPELGDKKIELEDDREPSLSDKILELEDDREPELETNIHILPSSDQYGGPPEELYDQVIEAPENENGEVEELYDQVIEAPENENNEVSELSDKIIEGLENENDEVNELSDKIIEGLKNESDEVDELETNIHILPSSDQYEGPPEDLSDKVVEGLENEHDEVDELETNIHTLPSSDQDTSNLSDNELYELAMKLASEGEKGSGDPSGWLQKVEGLMSTYLSSDILTPKRAVEFRDAINNSLEMSYFGTNVACRVPIDTSCGTTWAKAEEKVGEQITGTNRRDALDQMIVKLVDYGKVNLPGSSLNPKDAIKDAVGNLKSGALITGDIKHPSPMNKPLNLSGLAIPGGAGDSVYQAANSRTNLDTLDLIGDTVGTTFYDRYWNSSSFKTTLEELCPTVGKAPISSLAELKALLKASPYFTSPGKFMTDTKGSYNTKTLDTNMYWEVVIEPFCSDSGSCSNGNYSFLPSIQEINYINKELHKVSTSYGFWAPINSFELQKSKLITKSLPLYEGEISYPTGMDFTNELRLTFVDDSWKSWKRYFERCAEVAVYNSESHNKDFYSKKISSLGDLTKIDKTHFCVSSYKNITFNVRIYILNPQLNLLNKYSLLCVLKDYAEEYVGEIDSGGSDLSVTFSIVGENPEEDVSLGFSDATKYIIKELAKQVALETQKRVTGAINSSIGLI